MLQERQIHRVGGIEPIPVSFRVVAATHRDLSAEIPQGRFREDLWFRLQGCALALPPLRERKSDLLPLARHFLERAALKHRRPRLDLSAGAEEALLRHPWPGNIRELENKMEWLTLMAAGTLVQPEELGLAERPGIPGSGRTLPATGHMAGSPGDYSTARVAWQRDYLRQLLAATGGNVSLAAREAGISRAAFQELMRKLGIRRDEFVS